MESLREPPELIGEAPSFLEALQHASSAASLDRPLLVCGERGAGKELFASRIHFLSPRWDGPFVKVNCAALSDELLDSELFGHEAGAFTGAQKRRLGRFERAEGGTLFLDEIPSASLRVQEKLLRIIEYGEYERLGGETTLTADVRVIAAANVDLPALAEDGAFRADLLDRLAFDVVYAPPLRERREDIPLLAAHFGAQIAREMGVTFNGFTPKALTDFLGHDWPGNVRELKNAAERSVYRWTSNDQSGPIDELSIDPFEQASHMRPMSANTQGKTGKRETARDQRLTDESRAIPTDLRAYLDEAEKNAVRSALALTGGNQRQAAERLTLSYDQMRGLVRKHKLSAKEADKNSQ